MYKIVVGKHNNIRFKKYIHQWKKLNQIKLRKARFNEAHKTQNTFSNFTLELQWNAI